MHDLFGAQFNIELLDSQVVDSERFKRQGVSRMLEQMWLLTKKRDEA